MKHRLAIVLLAVIFCFSTFSCNKEDLNSSLYGDNGSTGYNNHQPPGQTLMLVANDWKLDQTGVYSHTFRGVLTEYAGKRVTVYLATNGADIPLYGSINYMNGSLSAAHTSTDLKIVFSIYGQLPFSSLDIKVVIQ